MYECACRPEVPTFPYLYQTGHQLSGAASSDLRQSPLTRAGHRSSETDNRNSSRYRRAYGAGQPVNLLTGATGPCWVRQSSPVRPSGSQSRPVRASLAGCASSRNRTGAAVAADSAISLRSAADPQWTRLLHGGRGSVSAAGPQWTGLRSKVDGLSPHWTLLVHSGQGSARSASPQWTELGQPAASRP